MLVEELHISEKFLESVKAKEHQEYLNGIAEKYGEPYDKVVKSFYPYLNFGAGGEVEINWLEPGVLRTSINFPDYAFDETRNDGKTTLYKRWETVMGNFDKSSYCVADNIAQLREYWKELIDDKERKFLITCGIVRQDKSNAGKEDGWRWHKWGPYIGDLDPQCEYLDDEEFGDDWQGYVLIGEIIPILK